MYFLLNERSQDKNREDIITVLYGVLQESRDGPKMYENLNIKCLWFNFIIWYLIITFWEWISTG
jgi:hypothetical protein